MNALISDLIVVGRPRIAPSWLTALLSRWTRRAPHRAVPPVASALFAMADAYEATQPSYAADLRVAAMRTLTS